MPKLRISEDGKYYYVECVQASLWLSVEKVASPPDGHELATLSGYHQFQGYSREFLPFRFWKVKRGPEREVESSCPLFLDFMEVVDPPHG